MGMDSMASPLPSKHQKLTWQWKKQPVEDASPIKNAEFSMVMLVFRGVPGRSVMQIGFGGVISSSKSFPSSNQNLGSFGVPGILLLLPELQQP